MKEAIPKAIQARLEMGVFPLIPIGRLVRNAVVTRKTFKSSQQ